MGESYNFDLEDYDTLDCDDVDQYRIWALISLTKNGIYLIMYFVIDLSYIMYNDPWRQNKCSILSSPLLR
jgi:hypothetical protein